MQASTRKAVGTVMERSNRVWLDGQVESLAPLVDPDVGMVFAGFTGRTQGREQFLAGFADFCENAQVVG